MRHNAAPHVTTEDSGSRHTLRTAAVLAAAAALTAAGAGLAGAAPGSAQAGSTTVTPAGDHFSLHASGGTVFTIGNMPVTCSTSSSDPGGPVANNQVPPSPGNHNAAGPVTIPLNPVTFANCTTNQFGTSATIATSGPYSLALQSGASSTGTLSVGTLTITVNGLGSCTYTTSSNLSGTWTNGSPSQLKFAGVTVPVSVSGGPGCPASGASLTFTATYNVTDTDNTSANITVGP